MVVKNANGQCQTSLHIVLKLERPVHKSCSRWRKHAVVGGTGYDPSSTDRQSLTRLPFCASLMPNVTKSSKAKLAVHHPPAWEHVAMHSGWCRFSDLLSKAEILQPNTDLKKYLYLFTVWAA